MVGSKHEAGTCTGVLLLSLYRRILALPGLLRWRSELQVLDADPDVTSPSRVPSHSPPLWMLLGLVRTTLSCEGAGIGGHLQDGSGLLWAIAALVLPLCALCTRSAASLAVCRMQLWCRILQAFKSHQLTLLPLFLGMAQCSVCSCKQLWDVAGQ